MDLVLCKGFYGKVINERMSVNEVRKHVIHVYKGLSFHLTFALTELSLTTEDFVLC